MAKITVADNAVAANAVVNHAAMTAAQIAAATRLMRNIVMHFGENTQLNAIKRVIPANEANNTKAQEITILTASDITIDGLDGPRVVNFTRILSEGCPGCDSLQECATYLTNHNATEVQVDIEVLNNYGGAQRFTNVNIH